MLGSRVLVAEDEEKLRKIIKKYLMNEGYTVYEASNGKEALRYLKRKMWI